MTTLYCELSTLAEGGSFETFVARTWNYWKKYIARRAPSYFGVEVEDIVQDVLQEVWRKLGEFDPAKYKSAAAFLRWHANIVIHRRISAALGHPRRVVAGFKDRPNTDADLTPWMLPYDPMSSSDGPYDSLGRTPTLGSVGGESTMVVALDARRKLTHYLELATPHDRKLLLAAFQAGSPGAGAELLCSDPQLREVLGFKRSDPTAIRRAIRRAVVRTMKRIAQEQQRDGNNETAENDDEQTGGTGGGCAVRQGERESDPVRLPRCVESVGDDGRFSDGFTARERPRRRRRRQESSAVVQSHVA